tara:strand:+ start:11442 stop:12011 length:570 start_codon:yes stop_codon:yes gene_type:complete
MNKNKVEEILAAMSNNYAASVNSESAMADNAAELLSLLEGVDGHDQVSIADLIACRQWSDWHNGQNEAYASNEKFSWTKLCRALSAAGWFYSTARKGLAKAFENVNKGEKFKSSLIQSVVFPPAQNDRRKRTDNPKGDKRSMDWKKAEKKISDLTSAIVKVKAPKRGKEYESAKASMILAAAKLGLKVG